jgi:hypothetical protein
MPALPTERSSRRQVDNRDMELMPLDTSTEWSIARCAARRLMLHSRWTALMPGWLLARGLVKCHGYGYIRCWDAQGPCDYSGMFGPGAEISFYRTNR